MATLEDFLAAVPKESKTDTPKVSLESFGVGDTQRAEQAGITERFAFGLGESRTLLNNLVTHLQAAYPMGGLSPIESTDSGKISQRVFPRYEYKSAEELYGADINSLPYQERLIRIKEAEDKSRLKDLGYMENTAAANTFAAKAGKFIGSFLDPTLLIPIGTTYKAMAAGGGLYAGTSVGLSESLEGKVDPAHVALATVGGALLVPATMALIRAGQGAMAKIQNKMLMKKAYTIMDSLDEAILKEAAVGTKGMGIIQKAADSLKISSDDIVEAMALTDRKFLMPGSPEQAKALLESYASLGISDFKKAGMLGDIIQPMIDRVEKISKPAWNLLRKYDMDTHVQFHQLSSRADPFFQGIEKLSREEQFIVTKALAHRDKATIEIALRQHPKALEAFKAIRNDLDYAHDVYVNKLGYKQLEYFENYYPRVVENYPNLLKKMGRPQASAISEGIKKAEEKLSRQLTDIERSRVINKVLRGYGSKGEYLPTGVKGREISKIPDNWFEDYADIKRALHLYYKQFVHDANKREFFGRNLAVNQDINSVDIERSIGAMVASDKELMANPLAQEELRRLLVARFSLGEMPVHKTIQFWKNIGYSLTLGNPWAAITQLGDVPITMYRMNFVNTLQSLLGKKYITAIDLGLKEIAEELSTSPIKTAKFLQVSLKYSGFTKMDMFTKTLTLNSAFNKYSKLALNEKGITKIMDKYGKAYTPKEFLSLVDGLQNKIVNDEVKLMLWHELADIQPIALSEMPLNYVKNPNLRWAWMLKSFTIKQLNILRKDSFREIAGGNYHKGIRNLLAFTFMLSAGNFSTDAIKRWLSGREIKESDVPSMALNSLYRSFAASEYTANHLLTGKISSAVADIIAPPVSIIDAVFTDIYKNLSSKPGDKMSDETSKYAPMFGKFYFYWFGNGLEKEIRKRELEEKRKNKPPELAHKRTRNEQLFYNLGVGK